MPTETLRRGKRRWRAVVKQDGRIVASKWFGPGPKGRSAAVLWEAEWRKKAAEEQAKTLSPEPVPLAWIVACLEDAKRRYADRTYWEKKTAMDKLLAFVGGEGTLSGITPRVALNFLQAQVDERSSHVANRDRKNLAAAWDWGRRFVEGFPAVANPFRAVDKFAEERHPRHIPTEADFWAVYEIAQEQDKIMLLAFLHTAARKMEIFRLRWDDLDFEDGRVRLWTRKRLGGTLEPDWIPMTEDLRAALLELKKRTNSLHVFAQPENGRAFTSRQHWLRTLCDRAGIPRFDIHSIRHLTASILDKSGLPLTTIQAILRHKSATTTARYLHSLRGTKAALDEVFGSGKVVSLFREKSAGAGCGQ